MTIRLSFREKIRRLIADSKGFSSVIGTTFMVLVMMFLGTSVFLWTLSQNTFYNEAVREKNQLEVDRLNEIAKAFDGKYTVSDGGTVQVNAELQNTGPLSVQFTTIWVYAVNNTWNNYNYSTLSNINLGPGDSSTITTNVTIIGSSSSNSFSSWLITERGNVVPVAPAAEEQSIQWANLAEGIGSLAFNFSSFRYYGFVADDQLADYPDGNPTFKVPHGATIAFGFELTNYNPLKESITFDEHSQMWSYFPASPGQTNGPLWYVANVNPDGTIEPVYSEITLGYEETKLFVFANQGGKWDNQQKNTLGAINLLMYGRFGSGMEYAQNIPFVAIFAYS